MKKLGRFLTMTFLGVLFTSFTAMVSLAQACPSLVQSAIEAIDQNCNNLGRNTACYGYNLVSAEFAEDVEENTFSNPSDRVGIASLQKIQTAQLDVDAEQWGVGVLSIQANIPNTLPGQAVTMILVGDAELENAVLPEDAFTPSDGITVTALNNINIRSGFSLRSNVIAVAQQGTSLIADGFSPDGEWVRVATETRIGWVNAGVVEATESLDALPILDGTQRMPMQAFFLRTGIGAPECSEATNNVLLVQGPKTVKVDITVNGAAMQVGSTVIYRILDDNQMEIVVIDGEVRILGGGQNGQDLIVSQGYRSVVCLGNPENLGVDGEANDQYVSCPFSEPEEVPLEELGAQYCVLEGISPDALNYPIDLLCEGEDVQAFLANYNPTPVPTLAPPVDICATFALLDPLQSVTNGFVTFSWTPVSGATSYVVNFSNAGGEYIGGQLLGDTTSYSTDIFPLPHAGTLKWNVVALQGDSILCGTGDATVAVLQPPVPVVVAPPVGFKVSFSCGSSGVLNISWNNAKTSDSIMMNDVIIGSMTENTGLSIGSGSSGSYVYDFSLSSFCYSNVGASALISSSGATASPSGLSSGVGSVTCTCP